MNFMGRIGRILDFIIVSFSFVAGLLLAFILLSVCLEVVMRYFFNRPLQWVVELTEYALLYITFLGTAWLLRSEGHINVDVFLTLFSRRAQSGFKIFSSIIGIIVSFWLLISFVLLVNYLVPPLVTPAALTVLAIYLAYRAAEVVELGRPSGGARLSLGALSGTTEADSGKETR